MVKYTMTVINENGEDVPERKYVTTSEQMMQAKLLARDRIIETVKAPKDILYDILDGIYRDCHKTRKHRWPDIDMIINDAITYYLAGSGNNWDNRLFMEALCNEFKVKIMQRLDKYKDARNKWNAWCKEHNVINGTMR